MPPCPVPVACRFFARPPSLSLSRCALWFKRAAEAAELNPPPVPLSITYGASLTFYAISCFTCIFYVLPRIEGGTLQFMGRFGLGCKMHEVLLWVALRIAFGPCILMCSFCFLRQPDASEHLLLIAGQFFFSNIPCKNSGLGVMSFRQISL